MLREMTVMSTEKRKRGTRMMMGMVVVVDDMKERRIMTATIVSRRLMQDARVETTK